MNGWAAQIISQEVADKVGKVWGLGSDTTKDPGPWEGEQRNMWKPTQQEALWFHGGNLHQSHIHSSWRSNSKPGWRVFRPRFTGCRTYHIARPTSACRSGPCICAGLCRSQEHKQP